MKEGPIQEELMKNLFNKLDTKNKLAEAESWFVIHRRKYPKLENESTQSVSGRLTG